MKKEFADLHNSFHACPMFTCSKVVEMVVLTIFGVAAVIGAIVKSGVAPSGTMIVLFVVLWLELVASYILNAFGPFLIGTYAGVVSSFYFVEQALYLTSSLYAYEEFTFYVPVVMGLWSMLGYKLSQCLKKYQWRWIITFACCFTANVIVGKISGFSDALPGLPYAIVFISLSAALCIFVVFGVMRSIETLVFMQEGPGSQLHTLAMELGIADGRRPNSDQIVLPTEHFWLTILDVLFVSSFLLGWGFTSYGHQDFLEDNPLARAFHTNYIFVGIELGWGRIIANCLWGLMLFPMVCYSFSQWLRTEHSGDAESVHLFKINSVLTLVGFLLVGCFSLVLAIRPTSDNARSIYLQAGGFMCGLLGFATVRVSATINFALSKDRIFSDHDDLYLLSFGVYWFWCLCGSAPMLKVLIFDDVDQSLKHPPLWDDSLFIWSWAWSLGIVGIPAASIILKCVIATSRLTDGARSYYLNADQLHEATDMFEDWLGNDKLELFRNMAFPSAFGVAAFVSCSAFGANTARLWVLILLQWLLLLLVMKFGFATSYVAASNGVVASFFFLVYQLEHPHAPEYETYSLVASIAISNTVGFMVAKLLEKPRLRWAITCIFSFCGQLLYGNLSSDTEDLNRIQYLEYILIWGCAHVFATFGLMRGCEAALIDWFHMVQDQAPESNKLNLREPSAALGVSVVHTSQPLVGPGSLLVPPKTLWLKIFDIGFIAIFAFGWAGTVCIDTKQLADNAILQAYGANTISLGVAYGSGRLLANLTWAVVMMPLGAFCCTSYCFFVQSKLNQALVKIQGTLLTMAYLLTAGFGISLSFPPEDHVGVDKHTWGIIMGFSGMALLRLSEVVCYCNCYSSPWPKNGDVHVLLASVTAAWIFVGLLPYFYYMFFDPEFNQNQKPWPWLDSSAGLKNIFWFLVLFALIVTSWTYFPKDCARFYICELPAKRCETYDVLTLWFRNGVWYWAAELLLRCPYIWYPVAALALFAGQQSGYDKNADVQPDFLHFFLYSSGLCMAACYIFSALILIIKPPFRTKNDVAQQLCRCLSGSAALNEKLNCYAYTMLLPMGIVFGFAHIYLIITNLNSCTFWNPTLIAASIFAQVSWLLTWCIWLGHVLMLPREREAAVETPAHEYQELKQLEHEEHGEPSWTDSLGLHGIMGTASEIVGGFSGIMGTASETVEEPAVIEESTEQTNCDLFCNSQCGTGFNKAGAESESLLKKTTSSEAKVSEPKKEKKEKPTPMDFTSSSRYAIISTIIGSGIMFGTIVLRLLYFALTHGGLMCY